MRPAITTRSQNVVILRFGSLPLPGLGFSTLWGCMGQAYHDAQAARFLNERGEEILRYTCWSYLRESTAAQSDQDQAA